MAQETIDDIIKRKQQEKAASDTPVSSPEGQTDKFFSILVGDGVQENFLEVQTKDGLRTCFPYSSIMWMVYNPEGAIHIEFTGFWVYISGRGLVPKLFDGLKQKRVAWVKEADHELQDHKDNEIYISSITITPPSDSEEEENPA